MDTSATELATPTPSGPCPGTGKMPFKEFMLADPTKALGEGDLLHIRPDDVSLVQGNGQKKLQDGSTVETTLLFICSANSTAVVVGKSRDIVARLEEK